ncbi:MAG: choice-of-anchor Q domain-containing protein [Blastocatellia bacterium]
MKKIQFSAPISIALPKRGRLIILILVSIWVSAGALTMTWNGGETKAQTIACSISQLTSGQSSTASINAVISDDGSRVAIAATRNPTGGNADINQEVFIYTIATGTFTQVTNSTGGFNRHVSINANGSRIAFTSNRDLTGGNADLNVEIFFYDVGTAAITQVTNTTLDVPPGSGRQYWPNISGDGSRIAFLSTSNFTGNNSDQNDEYFLYEILSGNFTQLTSSSFAHPAPFTPPGMNFTGSEINFLHHGNMVGTNADGNLELWRRNINDLVGLHQVTNTTSTGFESFTSPTMTSGGVLYSFSSVANLGGTNPGGDHEIFINNGGGSSFTAITEGNGTWIRKTWPDISAAGTHIAFKGDRHIVRYDIAASSFTLIPETSPGGPGGINGGSQRPSISADGSRIAFYSNDNLTGGNPFNHEEIFLATCAAPTPTPPLLVVNRPDDSGDGICDGTCTLRDAVTAANTVPGDDTITFAAFLTNVTLANEITINGNNGSTQIKGLGADKLTINGGPGLNRIFYLNLANATISDLTLTGGDGEGTPIIGVNGTGGAIGANGGSLRLDRVHVTGNTAAIIGGGINHQNGALRITNSTISGNSSSTCGGLTAGGVTSTLNVANSTVSGNTATLHGGGICSAGAANFRNVTITENSADQGGGIRSTGQVNLGNTIVAGNTAATAYPEMDIQSGASASSIGFNLVGDSAGDAQATNTPVNYDPMVDILDTPPQLIALGNYGGTTPTHAVQFGSPAIDNGSQGVAFDPADGTTLLTDQRGNGFDREVGNVDIGAFEVQSARTYVTQTADANGACDANCSLREAIAVVPIGGTVEFAGGFTTATPIIVESEIFIDKNITISGPGADKIVISTDITNHRIFYSNTLLLTISGVTLTGGAGAPGGAIYANGGSLAIDGVHFLGNTGSGGGGGIYFNSGFNDSIIRNSTFSQNDARGGGFLCRGIGSSFTEQVTIINSTFTSNFSVSDGPAFASEECNIIARNITVSGNTGINNGGIFITSGGTLNIGNSIVSGNTATTTDPQFLRPEISLFQGASATSAGNNLIGDSPGEAANTFIPIAYQPSDILDTPPMLGPLQYNGGTTPTMELLSGSFAINSGSNALAVDPFNNTPLLTDQRGFVRFIGSPSAIVDIGAFEFGSAASWSSPTPPGANVNVTAGPVSVNFAGVTGSGNTTVSPIDPATAGQLPTGFTLGAGYPAYEISTTAVFTAPLIVCIQAPAVLNAGAFNALNVFHYENGILVDRTVSRDFPTKTICASVTSLSPFVVAASLAPSSADVSVSGRVVSPNGRAIANARVSITNAVSGVTLAARSNSFGNYRITEVESGQTYLLSALHKAHQFAPRIITVNEDLVDADLVAEPGEESESDKKK